MIKPRRILFMSAPFGHGHHRAAQAVVAAVKKCDSSVDTRLVDVFDEYPDFFGNTLAKAYLRFVAKVPGAYGRIYEAQNDYGRYLSGRSIMHAAGAYKMLKLVKRVQPSAIVCTHFLPAGILDFLTNRRLINIPIYAIITDYSVHYWWVFQHLRKYFAGCNDMVHDFARYGVPTSKVMVSGIPTNLDLSKLSTRTEIFARLELNPNIPVVSLMGGGTGMLPMDEIVEELDKCSAQFQIIAIAGTNVSMYRSLSEYKQRAGKTLRIFSYIDFVSDCMAASDIMISKPGGLTTAETLSIGLPLIIFKPIPGHEGDNTRFLVRNKAGLVAKNVRELANIVEGLLQCRLTLEELRQNALRLGRPEAAATIARELLRFE